MIDTTMLFNLAAITEDAEDTRWFSIVDPKSMGVSHPFGYPVIGSKKAFTYYKKIEPAKWFKIKVPFPWPDHSCIPNATLNARACQLYERKDLKNPVLHHKIVPLDVLTPDILYETTKIIKDSGGITYSISDIEAAKASFRTVGDTISNFKHIANSIYELDLNTDRKGVIEPKVGYITFFNLSHAVSTLNKRLSDGVAVIMRVVAPKASIRKNYLSYTDTIACIAANHKENVFIMDGTRIRAEGKIKQGVISHLIKKLGNTRKPVKEKSEASKGLTREKILEDRKKRINVKGKKTFIIETEVPEVYKCNAEFNYYDKIK